MFLHVSKRLAILAIFASSLLSAQTLTLPDPSSWPDTTQAHEFVVTLASQLADEEALQASPAVALLSGRQPLKLDEYDAKDNRSDRIDATQVAIELWAAAQSSPTPAKNFAERLAARLYEASAIQAHQIGHMDTYSLIQDQSYLRFLRTQLPESGDIDPQDADASYRRTLIRMVDGYARYHVMRELLPIARVAIESDRVRRYAIKTDVLIDTGEGVRLSAMVVQPRGLTTPSPAILTATIYSDPENNLHQAIEAAAHGYVGIVSDSRGKRLGSGDITPYENESRDVHAVIDWITKQSWSDGRIGMYGGSYLGYTQWAATRNKHPALKTIVPSVAAMPGQGLPMENNIFLNANYPWSAFVTNGKLNDEHAYDIDWRSATRRWFESGRPYRELDAIVGAPNPWLQKWLQHPAFDGYWQSMLPRAEDYAALDIPILSITGYFDDGQISALQYVRDHYHHNKDAQHYVVIGPYDHFSAQISSEAILRGYTLDEVAHIDVPRLTFEWFDHVFKGAPRPSVLDDRINYQLMGDNRWKHAPSLDALQQAATTFYFDVNESAGHQPLRPRRPAQLEIHRQSVDLADRTMTHNEHYYPYPIVQHGIEVSTGLSFSTEPFEADMELAGIIEGELNVRINKKDFDVGLVLFELKESGELFHLTYVLGRASFASDPENRNLLEPGKIETVPIPRSRMTAKKIAAGSRLLLLVDVNLSPWAQVNYGTGKDVSDESIADAGEPLVVEWMNTSHVRLPLRPLKP